MTHFRLEMINDKCYSIYCRRPHREDLELSGSFLGRLYPSDDTQRSVVCTKSWINISLYHFNRIWTFPEFWSFLERWVYTSNTVQGYCLAKQAKIVPRSLHFDAYRSYTIRHTHTHTHTLFDPSERVISTSQGLQHKQLTTNTRDENIHTLSGIRTREHRIQEAADLRLCPHGHRNRHFKVISHHNFSRVNCTLSTLMILKVTAF